MPRKNRRRRLDFTKVKPTHDFSGDSYRLRDDVPVGMQPRPQPIPERNQ